MSETLTYTIDPRVLESEFQRPFRETLWWWTLPAVAFSAWKVQGQEIGLVIALASAGWIVLYLIFSSWSLKRLPREIRMREEGIEVVYRARTESYEFGRMRLVVLESASAEGDDGAFDLTIYWEEGGPRRRTWLEFSKLAYFFHFGTSDFRRIRSWILRRLPRERVYSV